MYVNLGNVLHRIQYLAINSSDLLLLSESGSYVVVSKGEDTIYGTSTVSNPPCDAFSLQFLQSPFRFHFHAFSFIVRFEA